MGEDSGISSILSVVQESYYLVVREKRQWELSPLLVVLVVVVVASGTKLSLLCL